MIRLWRPLFLSFFVLTAITGGLYPLAVAVIGRVAFAPEVGGSLLMRQNQVIGSSLIGQSFQSPANFWGRLSATSPMPNNAAGSGGSNFGPTNPALLDAAKSRIQALRAADPDNATPIPVDLVTASASGLDPDISPAAALYQIDRVARARGMDPRTLSRLVHAHIEGPQWGVFGEARVNVLRLNLALDEEAPQPAAEAGESQR